MAPSPILISTAPRAFGMKSTTFGNKMPTTFNTNRRSSPTKRPLAIFSDENVDPTHPKRVKSTLTSCEDKENILFDKKSPSVKNAKPSRFVLTDRTPQLPQQKVRTSTVTSRVEKSKPRVGSSLKNVILNASPPRRRTTTPPRKARNRRAAFAVRVDPPVLDKESAPNTSIDSVISSGSEIDSLSLPNNAIIPRDAIPDSWQFTIYEDSAEETLQNLMEHSATTLDLSDDETSRTELTDIGKENIPPTDEEERRYEENRHEETPTISPMSIDLPTRRTTYRRTKRQALREMAPAELVDEESEKPGKVPNLEKEGSVSVVTPEKPVLAPKLKGASKFAVWKDPSLTSVSNAALKASSRMKPRIDAGKKRGLSEI
ncbi:hypothetical protein P167DRAFT_160150 [Morchella conica CCBAS932]|uniref:Uncharacterized protein n=1 Tax=Morchella conica CCBAS932 TaxID=1392247 RepID=A0A3N4KPM3_9PEZI|nr:hypothetical protein P167DRAFT_160150 [Morchella conica CCBAS932]